MSAAAGNRWYVVRTHARAERKALFNLRGQGFESYLPEYLKSRRHARRTITGPAPLFPRYLFVHMDILQARWRCIMSTFGVADLVCVNGRPAPVPNGVVEGIRRREAEDGYVVIRRAADFIKGQALQVTDGALADQVGRFDGAVDQDRVRLLLELLGRQVRVELPLRAVAAVT